MPSLESKTLQWKGKEGKLGTNAIKRVAAGAHLPTPWLFEPAKCPDDRADYCLDCSFLPQCKHQVPYSFLLLSGVGRALCANSGESWASWYGYNIMDSMDKVWLLSTEVFLFHLKKVSWQHLRFVLFRPGTDILTLVHTHNTTIIIIIIIINQLFVHRLSVS